MTILLIILAFIGIYSLIGFIFTRLFLPQMIRFTTHELEMEHDESPLTPYRQNKVHGMVMQRSLCMTFGWPIYVPVTLAYRTADIQVQTYDPRALTRLERQLHQLQLRQIEQAKNQKPAPNDDNDDREQDVY